MTLQANSGEGEGSICGVKGDMGRGGWPCTQIARSIDMQQMANQPWEGFLQSSEIRQRAQAGCTSRRLPKVG